MLIVYQEEPDTFENTVKNPERERDWLFRCSAWDHEIEDPNDLQRFGAGRFRVWKLDVGKSFDKKIKRTAQATLVLEVINPVPVQPKVEVL